MRFGRVLVLALGLGVGGVSAAGAQGGPFNAGGVPPPMNAQTAAARQLFIDGRYGEALAVLRPRAEAGDAVAQNLVGVAYDHGLGYARDPVAAAHWLRRAAEQGDARAQQNLGQLLRDGRPGVPDDQAEARRWLQAASDQGYGPAHAALGRMLQFGLGGAADLPGAVALYRQGEAAGDPWSLEYLALLYLDGNGVEQDPAQARRLFAAAGQGGVAAALGNLGLMTERGMGGPADPAAAEALYRQGVAGGDANSAYNLAGLLFDRAGDAPDTRREAAAQCDWALARADADQRDLWLPACQTIRKYAHGLR